jgi:hypothetical protein
MPEPHRCLNQLVSLPVSSAVDHGSSPGWVKPKTVSPLSMQFQ